MLHGLDWETYLLFYEILTIANGFLREDSCENILSWFRLCVSEEAERRAIFSEAVIESLFLVPSVAGVVDLMVDFWIQKVKLV